MLNIFRLETLPYHLGLMRAVSGWRRAHRSILKNADSAESMYALLCLIAIGQEHILLLQAASAGNCLPSSCLPSCICLAPAHAGYSVRPSSFAIVFLSGQAYCPCVVGFS